MHRRWLIFAMLGAAVLLPAQSLRPHLLVSTEWLAARLGRPGIVVLHVTRDPASYRREHIPGARLLAWDQFTVVRDGVPNELPPPEQLAERFAALGVSETTRVVLYGDPPGLVAARAFFTLDYLGHGDRVALLDGGLEKWRAEGRPLAQGDEPEPARGRLSPRVRARALVDYPFVRKVAEAAAPGVLLLDTRPLEEYTGARASGNPLRRGHIPGAVNFYWPSALANREMPVFKAPAELRRLFEQVGAGPGRRLVVYCGSGVQASLVYFLARYLGYDVALYDGSMSEWARHPDAPLVTGPEPR